jgi:hypothetical protein
VELSVPGSLVSLRDVVLDDAHLLDAWSADPLARGEFNDFGMPHRAVDREALARGPFRSERNGEFMVERLVDRQPVGTVS